jgi:hypothetical protein
VLGAATLGFLPAQIAIGEIYAGQRFPQSSHTWRF